VTTFEPPLLLEMPQRKICLCLWEGEAPPSIAMKRSPGKELFPLLLELLKQDTSNCSLKQKRKEAAWDTNFLEKLLF